MDVIRNYVESMFIELQKKEVIEMKLNMIDHMNDKYEELKEEGRVKMKQ